MYPFQPPATGGVAPAAAVQEPQPAGVHAPFPAPGRGGAAAALGGAAAELQELRPLVGLGQQADRDEAAAEEAKAAAEQQAAKGRQKKTTQTTFKRVPQAAY